MNYKTLALILLCVIGLYKLWKLWLEKKSVANPTPENVRDVYDKERYSKWRSYSASAAKGTA